MCSRIGVAVGVYWEASWGHGYTSGRVRDLGGLCYGCCEHRSYYYRIVVVAGLLLQGYCSLSTTELPVGVVGGALW